MRCRKRLETILQKSPVWQRSNPVMKRIALMMAVALFATSLTGCGCYRRVRGWLCRGAYCGTQAPVIGSVRAPAPAPIVTAPPVVSPPRYVQPVTTTCVPCCPAPCPCPTVVCDPCCDPCCESSCNSCCEPAECMGCTGGAPFGINVAPGEYLGEIESTGDSWAPASTPTEPDGLDPGPAG